MSVQVYPHVSLLRGIQLQLLLFANDFDMGSVGDLALHTGAIG